jgi:hypothetical protein
MAALYQVIRGLISEHAVIDGNCIQYPFNNTFKGGIKMKKSIFIGIFLILVLCLLGAQSKLTNPFEGNWELLSSTGTYPDEKGGLTNASFKKDANNYHMKVIHNDYFMFAGQEMVNGVATPSYGYGTYSFKNNVYTENIIYHVDKAVIGKSMSFEMTVKGNTLIQKGPLKTGDFKDAKFEFTETYVRK